MTARRNGWRTLGAFFAAYLLVLQAALTGAALGAESVRPDPAGLVQILCNPSGTQDGAATAPEKHQARPACCAPGCLMLGAGMAPPPAFAALAPIPATKLAGLFRESAEPGQARPARRAASPRAPPATA